LNKDKLNVAVDHECDDEDYNETGEGCEKRDDFVRSFFD
jgi:hypothetical protein